jgi:hypothetical protein
VFFNTTVEALEGLEEVAFYDGFVGDFLVSDQRRTELAGMAFHHSFRMG